MFMCAAGGAGLLRSGVEPGDDLTDLVHAGERPAVHEAGAAVTHPKPAAGVAPDHEATRKPAGFGTVAGRLAPDWEGAAAPCAHAREVKPDLLGERRCLRCGKGQHLGAAARAGGIP